ncbi:protein phosphatase PTC6 [Entomortierella parvispora]|uniref:Protein phosphatase PTC6 n=1 Tax=Entomortierella parvispora TaxID=205924 RepID=A0A9P3H4S2_9FUNG|nr:protein phosphatase PTC6 [Entomortierella parvispora]
MIQMTALRPCRSILNGGTQQQTRGFGSSTIRWSQPYFAMKNSQGDTLRINLSKSRDFVGIRSTRCQRKHNQDRYKVLVLNPPTLSPELSAAAAAAAASEGHNDGHGKGSGSKSATTTTEGAQMDADSKTLFYFAIFDGHGGSHTADYLTANLDQYVEQAQPSMVPGVIKELRKLGGYFRSFRPHFLEPFLPSNFEQIYGAKKSAEARQQRRINIKGKGGKVKPMIFIPHPNASEEDQQMELESIQSSTLPWTEPGSLNSKNTSGTDETEASSPTNGIEEDEVEYDEDEDPFVIARRRRLVKSSPLPSGTTSYFGTDRSEYQNLFLREMVDPFSETLSVPPDPPIPSTMTLEQRLFLSFLKCDTELIRDKYMDGSTASIVVVQSKGAFWETQEDLDLIIAHVGDTRILLCEAPKGECVQLTTDHHPDAVVEADRIRKMAAYVSADSFGENMFLGQVANTRALGDVAMKAFGVSAEPELVRKTVKAKEAAFLVLISDGVSSVMSNQEVVDCVKLESNPTQAAANVLNLAEQLGAEDNCTVLVVKLPAWGTPMPDLSKELREYRWQSEAQQSRARRR